AVAPIKWPETQEEYRTWFEHWIERYRCMVDAGFDLEDAPSFDSWYEAMLAEEGYDVPYLLKNPNDLISAVRACPADPEAFWSSWGGVTRGSDAESHLGSVAARGRAAGR